MTRHDPLVRIHHMLDHAREAVRIPEDFSARYPDVPWRQTVGMRNRLIHGYDTVNFDILWAIIQKDLPPLIEQLEEILAAES